MTESIHITRSAILLLLFWTLAAFLVIALHRLFEGRSPVACVASQTVAILGVALIYMKVATSNATIDHGLFVGAAWLVLAIVTELVVTAHTGRGWFEIIGSPASALRNILMFAWILGPALFARHRG